MTKTAPAHESLRERLHHDLLVHREDLLEEARRRNGSASEEELALALSIMTERLAATPPPLPRNMPCRSAFFDVLDACLGQASHRAREDRLMVFGTAMESLLESCRTVDGSHQTVAELLSRLSHDLRSPMVSIQGYGELIHRQELGELTDSQRKGVGVILRNINLLVDIMENILLWARLEVGRETVLTEEILLMDILDDVVDLMEPRACERGITIHFSPLYPPPRVQGDNQKLHRMIRNILDNAIKFNREGGDIWVEVLVRPEKVGIVVRDNGPGLPPEVEPLLFRPFVKGKQRRSRGVGMGLFLVKAILDLHGGTIDVGRSPEGGCVFTMWLPSAV